MVSSKYHPEFDLLAYEGAKQKLVNMGYPEEVRSAPAGSRVRRAPGCMWGEVGQLCGCTSSDIISQMWRRPSGGGHARGEGGGGTSFWKKTLLRRRLPITLTLPLPLHAHLSSLSPGTGRASLRCYLRCSPPYRIQVLGLAYRPERYRRGLVLDKHRGNLLKMDR